MPIQATPPPGSRPQRSAFRAPAMIALCVLALGVLGAVFSLGRWSADVPPSPQAPLAGRLPEPPAIAARAVLPPRAALPAAAAAPPSLPASAVTPELVTRVTEATRHEVEKLRPYIVSRCWPAGAQARATLTFHVTFDEKGREIARGISEDRSAPAGEFGSCLANLEGLTLSIDAPGTNVGVRVPVTFP